jgi:hypothetical protein
VREGHLVQRLPRAEDGMLPREEVGERHAKRPHVARRPVCLHPHHLGRPVALRGAHTTAVRGASPRDRVTA